MSSGSRKEMIRSVRDSPERAEARARTRHPHASIYYPGVGGLLVQLLRAPAFEHTVAWEIRRHGEGVRAFRSCSPEPDQYLLTGYDEYAVDDVRALQAIASLHALAIPVYPPTEPFGVADGCSVELMIEVGFTSVLRLRWCEDHEPLGWKAITMEFARLWALLETATPVPDAPVAPRE